MKKKSCLLLLGLCFITSVAFGATLKVITQEAVIRKDKRFFSPPVARAPYDSVVQHLGREGDWLRVGYQGKQGWVHISAVQEQKFQPSSLVGGQAREASQDEVALAGKGFTPEVEKAFREKNPKMRYDLVDYVQSCKVDEARQRLCPLTAPSRTEATISPSWNPMRSTPCPVLAASFSSPGE